MKVGQSAFVHFVCRGKGLVTFGLPSNICNFEQLTIPVEQLVNPHAIDTGHTFVIRRVLSDSYLIERIID